MDNEIRIPVGIKIRCGKCDSNKLTAPNEKDESIVVCEDCGASLCSLGDLKYKAREAAIDQIRKRFGN